MCQNLEEQTGNFKECKRGVQEICYLYTGSCKELGLMIRHNNYCYILMKGALGIGKDVLLRRQYERNLQKHLDRIRQIRPNSTGWQWATGQPTLNQQKKHRLLEDKITEIQRENRYLLQKITHTIKKKSPKEQEIDKMNRSLNYSFRKRQTQSIDSENSKFLKRLQEKRSQYEAEKLKSEWKKQKQVIKNIAVFPFIIRDGSRRPRRRTVTKDAKASLISERNKLDNAFQLVRIRKIDGKTLIISIKLDEERLTIIGDDKKGGDQKFIQAPREQAVEFIEKQCQGKFQSLLDHLRYDAKKEVLALDFTKGSKQLKIDSQAPKNKQKIQLQVIEDI